MTLRQRLGPAPLLIIAVIAVFAIPRSAPNVDAERSSTVISVIPVDPSADEIGTLKGISGTASELIGAPRQSAGERLPRSSAAMTLHSRSVETPSRQTGTVPQSTTRRGPGTSTMPLRYKAVLGKDTGPSWTWHTAYASSYGIGDGFLGGHLACGGRLNAVALVVANRTLPCGTRLEVCFTRASGTHCSVAVVRDRGPYVAGRDFDLGPAVARAVHFDGLGVIRWRPI